MSDDSQRIIARTIALIFALPTILYTIRASREVLSIREGVLYSISTTIFLSYFMI